MKNILNKVLWGFFIFFSPITFISLLSQNTIPGDTLYPIKLSIERAGLLVFSLTPEAKASYQNSLTQRRFDEAEVLIVKNSNTSGLTTLVAQTEKTAELTKSITDPEKKKEVEKELIQNITEYQEKLTVVQKKVNPTFEPTITPTLSPTPQEPTIPPAKKPQQTAITPTPTHTPTPTPIPPSSTQGQPEIVENIEATKAQLEEIKQQIQMGTFQLELEGAEEDSHEESGSKKHEGPNFQERPPRNERARPAH